jgi:hypothetical protein
MTAAWAAPEPTPPSDRLRTRTRADLEGPAACALEGSAASVAGVLRTQARTRGRFERRMTVLDLLHRNPQLLVETVLALADDDAWIGGDQHGGPRYRGGGGRRGLATDL